MRILQPKGPGFHPGILQGERREIVRLMEVANESIRPSQNLSHSYALDFFTW